MKRSTVNFTTRNALAAVAGLALIAGSTAAAAREPLNRPASSTSREAAHGGPAGAPREKVLYSFMAPPDGHLPQAGLIADPAGNLYGTLYDGGVHGAGAVFELSPLTGGGWSETLIYSFHSKNDGKRPAAGLIFDAAGNLYGTTETGGAGQCSTNGCGTVFELSPQSGGGWTEKVLYSFKGTDAGDGDGPVAGVVFDGAGNLYGTTEQGGGVDCVSDCGTVFELSPQSGGNWTESVLYSFTGGADGGLPEAALILDAAGDLYGTTYSGGSGAIGTAFELVSLGQGFWGEKVLYSFPGGPHGAVPYAGLTIDASGNLYGTTAGGGSYTAGQCKSTGCGTVFELSPQQGGAWSETVLYAFLGYPSDGKAPTANVILDVSGNLYSTTADGGPYGCLGAGCGTVFELSPQQTGMWSETVLHNFTGKNKDGLTPRSSLIFDSTGKHLYGTTIYGGTGVCSIISAGCGTVFKVTP